MCRRRPSVRSPLHLPVVLLIAALPACGPTKPDIDTQWPDVPVREDGGTEAGDADPDGADGDATEADGDAIPLPEETENNDPFHGGAAEPLTGPVTIAGRIGPPGPDAPDWDVFSVSGAAGSMVRVTAYPSGGGRLDLAVRILRLDGEGNVVWERWGDDPSMIAVYRDAFFTEPGEVLVVLSDRANFSPSPGGWRGGSDMTYQISVSVLGPPTMTVPSLPWTWSGTIPTAGLLQAATFTPAAGTRVEAMLRTSNVALFDPLLTAWDAASGLVVAEDDGAGGGDDALVRFEASGGPLVFVIDHVTATGGAVAATLTLELRELDRAQEAEPNDRAATANVLAVGTDPLTGVIAAPAGGVEDRDLYRFEASAGRSYAIDVLRMGGAASDVDPTVSAWRSAEGSARLVRENPLAFADESPRRGDIDARLVVAARRAGTMYVEVRDARNVVAERAGLPPTAGGPVHRYTVFVSGVSATVPIDLGGLAAAIPRDDEADSGGRADLFRFSAPDGTPARFALTDLAPAGAPFAAVGYVTDAAGATILFALEPSARGAAEGFFFTDGAGGTLAVGDGLGAGDPTWSYRLAVSALTAEAQTETSAPNDSPASAQALAWDVAFDGVVVAGDLDASDGAGPDAIDMYRIDVAPGARVVAFTGPEGGRALDTVLTLRASDGTTRGERRPAGRGDAAVRDRGDGGAGRSGVRGDRRLGMGAGGYSLFIGTP